MKEELKKIYISLAQTIETGDNLKIGIVIGQVLSKLETLINENTTDCCDICDRHPSRKIKGGTYTVRVDQ